MSFHVRTQFYCDCGEALGYQRWPDEWMLIHTRYLDSERPAGRKPCKDEGKAFKIPTILELEPHLA